MKKVFLALMAVAAIALTGCLPKVSEKNFNIYNQSSRVVCVATGTIDGNKKFTYTDYSSLGAGCSLTHGSMTVPQSDGKIAVIVCKAGMATQNPDPEEAFANMDTTLFQVADIPVAMDDQIIVVTIDNQGAASLEVQ